MDLKEALYLGKSYYKDTQYADENREMRLILSKILEVDDSFFITHDDFNLNDIQEKQFFDILNRRKNGEPLQYILGNQDFYKYNFIVDRGVLIPRYDTEISVLAILDIIKPKQKMLEIGVGTGCVSISVALEQDVNIDAVDISEIAINNAKKNIEKFNCKNIKVFKSDMFENIHDKYDIIYSNPPYIKSKDIKNLQKEVLQEPITALDGGEDGLIFYREIINNSINYLKKNGFLIFEIGFDQANDVKNILKDYKVHIIKDLSGHDRVIVATKGELDVRKFRSF